MDDPAILDMRCELVIAALEGAHIQAQGTVRFLLMGERGYAVAAWDRMRVFLNEAAPEIAAIRTAVDADKLTAGAADRDRNIPLPRQNCAPSKPSEAA